MGTFVDPITHFMILVLLRAALVLGPHRGRRAAVEAVQANLLVVGARGVGGVARLLLGSVAEGALNQCPVPVLVVR